MVSKKGGVLVFAFTIFFVVANSKDFDSFWFVQQWPPALCRSFEQGQCIGARTRSFTIHGLWPKKGASSPTYCNGSKFNISDILQLETQLNNTWPDVIWGKNQEFWRSEWMKHGVCTESKFDEKKYFEIAIDMKRRLNPLGALVGGLAPNQQNKSMPIVQSALQAYFGKKPVLRCKNKFGVIGRLIGIVNCFADDGITLIDCVTTKSNCANIFMF